MLEKKDVVKVIIFSIVSCGFYALYWMYKTIFALDAEGKSSILSPMIQFVSLFFYVGFILFALNADANLNSVRQKKKIEHKDQKVLFLILGLVCPIILIGLVQNEINNLA